MIGALSPRRFAHHVYVPWTVLPEGRLVDLAGRGTTYVTDTPGPHKSAPTIVLLHALGCTGLLTWFPAIEPLSRRFRVVTLDQRGHGQGITDGAFSLRDCADDVAALVDVLGLERVIVAGYSMGGVVAQRVWRQHPHLVEGLVLASTADRFQGSLAEHGVFTGVSTAMLALRGVSRIVPVGHATRAAARSVALGPSDMQEWALREFRTTRPWAIADALDALGRHHSSPWLGSIDVPTAVVVTTRDHVIPPERQRGLARAIVGATTHEVSAGHAACVLQAERFVPALLEATQVVEARRRDARRDARRGSA